eukprot:TRINITY_DN65197_c0_g1_i1.p1 TRINITY_DN65197_c0_g1~~TRINITY_DN65197_c0_g1_i1.p1  ORF type:complete len:106 (+),score=11.02 TRINITY_DN65197_c0_g1_i1:3-320(+)
MLDYVYKLKTDYFTQGYNYKGDIIEINGVFQNKQSENERVSKRDYYLTLNCAKEIAMLQRNDRGKKAREYFVKCEETLKGLKENKRLEAYTKLEFSKKQVQKQFI